MEKIKLLLYCTKQPHKLFNTDKGFVLSDFELGDFYKDKTLLNGKIVAECDFEVEEIKAIERWDYSNTFYSTRYLNERELLEESYLTYEELDNYLKGNNGYAIYIKNLKERVMELSDVYTYDTSYNNMFGWIKEENEKYIPLNKAPQNMMRVWVYENGKWVMYILISVRPEWLCLELNGIKTVEVRKTVLKEML